MGAEVEAYIQGIMAALAWGTWVLSIAMYVYVSFCLQTIARKTDTEHGWLAWIPIANMYLMCKIAERPGWWLIFFFIPIANVVFMVIVWMGIVEARDKNKWLGLLMIVPLANLVFLGILAFAGEGTRAMEAEARVNPAVPAYMGISGGVAKVKDVGGVQTNAIHGYLSPNGQGMGTGGTGTQATEGTNRQAKEQTKPASGEVRKAILGIEPDTYGKSVRLVIPSSVAFEQVAQFKGYLKDVGDLAVVMIGGSVDEGSIITVSVRESVDLIRVLEEMPVVENARKKGEDIAVKLKPPVSQ